MLEEFVPFGSARGLPPDVMDHAQALVAVRVSRSSALFRGEVAMFVPTPGSDPGLPLALFVVVIIEVEASGRFDR